MIKISVFINFSICGKSLGFPIYLYASIICLLNYDFIIGTRIHGSIMAFIMNKPTLLIVINSRTYELAEKL